MYRLYALIRLISNLDRGIKSHLINNVHTNPCAYIHTYIHHSFLENLMRESGVNKVHHLKQCQLIILFEKKRPEV